MKTKIFALFVGLLCLLTSALSQSETLTGFNGRIKFTSFANNGLYVRGTLDDFLDQTNQYVASDIDSADVVWDNQGRRYLVHDVISSNLTQAVVDLSRIGGGTHIPTGVGFVSRETSNGLALIPPANSMGITTQLASRAEVHNFKILEGLKYLPYNLSPSTVNNTVNILKWTGNGSSAVPSFGLVPNWYNENGTLTTTRNTTLGGSNGDYYKLDGRINNKLLDYYLSTDNGYNADAYMKLAVQKTNGTNNASYFNLQNYVYGPGNRTYSTTINSGSARSPSSTGTSILLDNRRADGVFLSGYMSSIDSLSRLRNFLYFESDSSSTGRRHLLGFAYKTISGGGSSNVAVAPTKEFFLQTLFFNSTTKFNWLRVDNIDTDTTGNRISFYNDKYRWSNSSVSITPGAISTHIWTTGTPSFLRSQHGVATGTTDGSGDLTVTFAAAMPDATYSLIATVEGTTSYTISVHTKAAATCKVRFFNPATGSAVTATSVTISYEAKDY